MAVTTLTASLLLLLICAGRWTHVNSQQMNCAEDIVFLLDNSASLSTSDWTLMLGFVNSLVSAMSVSVTGTHVAVVDFASAAYLDFNLTTYQTADAVEAAVLMIPQRSLLTNTPAGLQLAHQMLTNPQYGGRGPSVPRVIILITNGEPNLGVDSLDEIVDSIHADDITVVVIQTTYAIYTTVLEAVANSYSFYHIVSDFSALAGLKNTILTSINCSTTLMLITPIPMAPEATPSRVPVTSNPAQTTVPTPKPSVTIRATPSVTTSSPRLSTTTTANPGLSTAGVASVNSMTTSTPATTTPAVSGQVTPSMSTGPAVETTTSMWSTAKPNCSDFSGWWMTLIVGLFFGFLLGAPSVFLLNYLCSCCCCVPCFVVLPYRKAGKRKGIDAITQTSDNDDLEASGYAKTAFKKKLAYDDDEKSESGCSTISKPPAYDETEHSNRGYATKTRDYNDGQKYDEDIRNCSLSEMTRSPSVISVSSSRYNAQLEPCFRDTMFAPGAEMQAPYDEIPVVSCTGGERNDAERDVI